MEKPWMPVVAGVLDIVSGAGGIMFGLLLALSRNLARAAQAAPGAAQRGMPNLGGFPPLPFNFPGMTLGLGIALILLGILAIVGGAYALKVKAWGLSLAGAIAGVITGRLLGVLALVLLVLGRKDFQK